MNAHTGDAMTVREARARFFADNGFSLADYDKLWVPLKLGPIPLGIVNIPARKRAVPLHDLHHIATGYGTDWVGEMEIGAWELGAGCGNYWVAWVLDGMSVALGALVAPRRTWAAWKRGRASRSLYDGDYDDSLLDLTVGELRQRLGLAGEEAQS